MEGKTIEEQNLYLRAELQNQAKRHQKNLEQQSFNISLKFLTGLLPILDGLEESKRYLKEDDLSKGFKGLNSQFDIFLAENNIKVLDDKGLFNPEINEAIGVEEIEELEDQQIVSIIQKGYMYKNKLLRASKVIVNKKEKKNE